MSNFEQQAYTKMAKGFALGFVTGVLYELNPRGFWRMAFWLWVAASLLWTYTAWFDSTVSESTAMVQFWCSMPFWTYLLVRLLMKVSRPAK